MYNTVIYDLDGTLIDSDYANMMSLKKAIFNIEGRDLSYDEVKKQSGIPGKQCLIGLGVKKMDETFKEWSEEFFRSSGRSSYFEGIEDTILKLKEKGVYVGIVTSRHAHEYDAFFSHLNLFEKFDTIVFASDTVNHKPHPEPILKFLEITGRKKDKSIYIGDTIYDRDAAIGAGLDFALAGWSHHEVECQLTIDNPCDILDMV